MARYVVFVRRERDSESSMFKGYVRTVTEAGAMKTVAVGPWRQSQVEATRDAEAGAREARRAA